MQYKFIPQLLMASKYMSIGLILQCFFCSFLMASESIAQDPKSVKEVFLSITFEEESLSNVFKRLQSATEYTFSLDHEDIKGLSKISGRYENIALYQILVDLSKKTGLNFKQVNNNINVAPPLPDKKVQAEIDIVIEDTMVSGKVIGDDGDPLPGVNVVLKGTINGTITDIDGNYVLNVPDENSVLIFSFIGFETVERTVGSQAVINVTMVSDITRLSEIVVIGYGTQEKKDLTGSIASVDAEVFETQPVLSATQMLRGRVAGFNTNVSTNPKGSSGYQIRGATSITASNTPLIVMDGIIYYGDLNDINPNDIKTIDVLKDASSAAVYGARAAAGVVIITTRKGKRSGKPTISVNSSVGIAQLTREQRPFGPEGYLQQRQDFATRQGNDKPDYFFSNPNELPAGLSIEEWRNFKPGAGSDEEIWLTRIGLAENEIANYMEGNTINWFDEVYQNGVRNDHNVSISGKGEGLGYYFSLGYLNNEGTVYGEQYESIRSRLNLDAEITDFLTFGVNTQFTNRNEAFLSADNGQVHYNSPYGDMYEEDGTLKWDPHNDRGAASNPFLSSSPDIDIRNNGLTLLANLFAEVKLPFGFKYRVNWVNRFARGQVYRFDPSSLPSGSPRGQGIRTDRNTGYWMVDNILSWKKIIADNHEFDLTLLYNVEKQQGWVSQMTNADFSPNESLGYHGLEMGNQPEIGTNDTYTTGDALMGRLNYSLMDRYLFTFSMRRDGYSAFGRSNPYAYFPAAAFAWRISNENFFNPNFVDDLKLRLSWGINGNREIGSYAALMLLRATKYMYGDTPYVGVYSNNMANHDLRWEQTEAFNAGLDFSLFGSRVSGSIDAYYMSTKDLLLRRRLPPVSGYEDVMANIGEVTNKGLELSLNTFNLKRSHINWKSSLIFSMNRNEVKHLYGEMEDIVDEEGNVIGRRESDDRTNGWFIGQALDRIYDYEVLGVWQQGEEEEAKKYGREPGDFKLRDLNEDGELLPEDDKVFQGYRKPRYRISLNNTFTLYKNIEVSFLINSYLDYWASNGHHKHDSFRYGRANALDYPYWTPENPTNEWARLGSSADSPGFGYYVDRSFIRLQNLTVAYNFPKKMISRWKLNRLQAYVNLQNPALLYTKWDLWDPETTSPTPRIYTLGVNLSL